MHLHKQRHLGGSIIESRFDPIDTERFLDTPGGRLEPLVEEHAALLFDALSDPRLYAHIGISPPESRAILRERFRIYSGRRSPDGNEIWLNWAARRTQGEYVGWFQATIFADASADIAYLVFVPYWRRGYAKECVRRVLEHLRDDYRLARVRATIDTDNVASIRLAESLGFTRIGWKDAEYRFELKFR